MSATDAENLVNRSKAIAKRLGKTWDERLERIIRFWVGPPNAFPIRRGRKSIESIKEVDDDYLAYYIARYYREREGVIVMQPVSTRPDPAVDQVLKAFEEVSSGDLERISIAHRLSMQAENIVGKLLERYIASVLEAKGWVWCAGETVRSVDFMKDEDTSDVKLLQIKNRDNSENSSSSAIRAGTTIGKWFRINSKTGKTRWSELPGNEDGSCTEEGFYEFVREEAKKRPPVEKVPIEEVIAQEVVESNQPT